MTCLLVISDREIPKITVHSNRRGTFYRGSLSGDAETQPILSESERTNLVHWLGDEVYRVLGQGYAETFAS